MSTEYNSLFTAGIHSEKMLNHFTIIERCSIYFLNWLWLNWGISHDNNVLFLCQGESGDDSLYARWNWRVWTRSDTDDSGRLKNKGEKCSLILRSPMFFHSVYAQLGFKKDKERISNEQFSRREIWLVIGEVLAYIEEYAKYSRGLFSKDFSNRIDCALFV